MRSVHLQGVSLVDVVSEVGVWPSVVVVSWVVHVLSVCLLVWVALNVVVSIVREEESVPGAGLLALLVLFVAEGLVVSLKSGALGHIKVFLGHHRREGAQLGALLPGVVLHAGVHCQGGEGETSNCTCQEEPETELLAGVMSRINIDEVMNPSWRGDCWHTTLSMLGSTSHPHSEG